MLGFEFEIFYSRYSCGLVIWLLIIKVHLVTSSHSFLDQQMNELTYVSARGYEMLVFSTEFKIANLAFIATINIFSSDVLVV